MVWVTDFPFDLVCDVFVPFLPLLIVKFQVWGACVFVARFICSSIITGRWSLPQYGPVTIVVSFARSGVHSVKSIVAFRLSVWDGLVPRFFGVAKMNLFSF